MKVNGMKQSKANSKKSPLKAKPLRMAGQSLDENIRNRLDDKGLKYAVLIVFPVVLAMMEWYRWYVDAPYTPWVYTFIAVMICPIGIYKAFKLKQELIKLKQGRDGEIAVGQYLESFREQGCKIFHDIVGEGFNLDHVVISKNGIFVIETKTYSKPSQGKATIQHKGDELIIDGFNAGSDILNQARAQVHWLRSLIEEMTGKHYTIKPVVVFPGWYIQSDNMKNDVWVLNPKALGTYISNSQSVLSLEEVSFLSYSISQYIRSNEQK